jgi:hypothetical protein
MRTEIENVSFWRVISISNRLAEKLMDIIQDFYYVYKDTLLERLDEVRAEVRWLENEKWFLF